MPAPTITSSGAKGPGAKKEDERAARRGGPKLGGSRSARAAMRQMEIAAEKVAVAEREAAVEKRGRKGR